jgi:hypothetical protein
MFKLALVGCGNHDDFESSRQSKKIMFVHYCPGSSCTWTFFCSSSNLVSVVISDPCAYYLLKCGIFTLLNIIMKLLPRILLFLVFVV